MKKFLMMYQFPLLVYLVALIVIGYRIDNDTYYLLALGRAIEHLGDRKSTRLNSSHP